MAETIAILFIFFVLLLFGLIFYYQFQKSSFEKQKESLLAERSIDVSLVATYLPEFVCKGIPTRKDCIDIYKLEILRDKINESYFDYYFDIFGFAKITVKEIYPGTRDWTLYERLPAEYVRVVPTEVPMSLFDPANNNYLFGVLEVEVYS